MIDPRSPDYRCTPVAPERPAFAYAPAPREPHQPAPPPAATIITPFFNTGPVFHQTARCVLGQSLQQFEWIIVNDCSTDPEALAVLDQYRALARTDPRIRIVDHRTNLGLSAARNTGFREARTPYVFMLDSDDLIEPTTLEKCAWFLECNPEFAFVKGWSIGFEGQQYLWTKGFHDGPAILEQNIVTATTMVRASVHREVGGFDETIRGGLEDWEFWLRCASRGHWGSTIPEYLDWYRRRPGGAPTDAWANLACSERHRSFRERMARSFPRLFEGGGAAFPRPARAWHMPMSDVHEHVPWANTLDKPRQRLLVILPWFRLGGADKFNLDLVREMTRAGWEVTLATTLAGHHWLPEFTRYTPDVFMLDHLAQPPHYPRLLRALINSRRPDVVLITNSELGYLLLPYLRAHCPGPAYVDYNHMEEEYWKNGGHPRHGAGMQDQLDLNIVCSQHLKQWMVSRGASPDRIEICPTNIDADQWKPDEDLRRRARKELGLDDDQTVLLYPVRLTMQKQPMVFADSIRRLAARLEGSGRRFIALVAGDGEDRPALEDYIRRHNLSSCIRMLGAVPLGRMPAMYNAADILFLPSMQEGVALSLFEAMAIARVVVAADVGGQRELVKPGTGFLLPLQSDKAAEAEAYAEVLESLIRDPARRIALGRAAREHVATNHRLADMGRRMQELFRLAQHHQRTSPRQALTPGLARELAVSGIDWVRTRDLCEYLWPFHERTMRSEAEQREREQAARLAAENALAHIESSSAWRLIRLCKNTPVYHLYARGRYGPDWQQIEPKADPAARLAHIRASRAYRLVTTVKKLPPITIVSRLRHGRDYRSHIPEIIRND